MYQAAQLSDGEMQQTRHRIFISYAQYEPAHSERVLALAHALAADGLDVELDQFHAHETIDWPRWCDERLRPESTDFVLMVCSAEYRRRLEGRVEHNQGRGVFWEGNLIYGYLYRDKANERFVPVLLDDEPGSSLPSVVANWNYFCLRDFGLQSGDADYEGLYRLLTGQPGTPKPISGELVRLPPAPLSSTAGVSGARVSPTLDAASTSALELADALSRHVADVLERIREQFRCGERSAAKIALETLIEEATWSALNAGLRGRILRTAALYQLLSDDDIEKAKDLAARAAEEDPEGDGQALAAHIALHTDGADAALAQLQDPGSMESCHLKAALLIEAGVPKDALTLLELGEDSEGAVAEPNAETWRLRSLALLALGRLTEAVDAIEQARSLGPDWLGVRSAAAVLAFWRACTPAALQLTQQPLWPMPFSRALVSANASAHARLEEAEKTFAEVAAATAKGSREWVHWQTWRLISLLSLGTRRDETSALASTLLEEEGPIHVWPLLWASYFELDLDHDSLKTRLVAVTLEDANFIILRGLYFEMCLADGDESVVLDELAKLEPLLEANGHQDILRQWKVLALTASGRINDAIAAADAITEEKLRLRLRLRMGRAQEKTRPGSHMAAADALFAADRGPDALTEACDAHATAADWAFVSAHADDLLAAMPTPGSLRLLVIAAWNQGEYRRCRDALDEHRHVYLNGRLPQDLALLRVRCQRMLGEVSQAARDARLLFEQDPSPDHLAELVNAQIEGGDGAGMLDSLRRVLVIEGADGDLLMQGAQLAAQMDRDLAVSLWRRAVSLGSDEKGFPVRAGMLGANLGLSDEETGPWFERMAQQAATGESGAWTLHISELPRVIREQQEDQQRLLDMYWHGDAAVYMPPEGTLAPLPVLFHGDPERSRAAHDPLLQPPILIRHGARPIRHLKPRGDQSHRLILDLTALLVAYSLGLLELVEKTFAPLRLPRQWHLLLREEINRLSHAQPRRLAAHDRIADLIRSGGIRLVDLSAEPTPPDALSSLVGDHNARELTWVSANGGRLLTYLPLHGPDIEKWQEVELSPDWSHLVVGPRALVDVLLAEDVIDGNTHRRAQAAFPSETAQPDAMPAYGDQLLTSSTMLRQFAELDLLAVLSHRFRLCIQQHDWNREEQEANQRERLEDLVTWTESLIERVSEGMQKGLYELLPSCAPSGAKEASHLKGLDDLLAYRGKAGDLVWIDDRFLNGYPSTGTTPIIGIVEVLDLLRATGTISREERFEWLYQLRASNARFIPLEADEILHWIGKARIESGRLVAPRQLGAIARYWTACLYQGSALKWEGNERHARGEIPFVLSSNSVVAEVLRKIWSDRRYNPRRRRQRADWVLDNLYVGVGDLAHLIPESGPERDMNLVGMDIGSLFFGAFEVLFHRPREVGKREKDRLFKEAEDYLRWICERIIAPRLRADPSAVTTAAAAIRNMLIGTFDQIDDDALPLAGIWMQRFFPIVPDTLRAELHKDQAFMQRLGLEEVTVAEIDGRRIAARDLWPAVESALRGAVPIIHDLDNDKPLTLRLMSKPNDERPVLEVGDAKGRPIDRHYFEHSEILSLSRDMRLQALHRNPHWWDGATHGCDEVQHELAGIDSPELRVRQLERLAAASADSHYKTLDEQWKRDKRIHIDRSFPPPLDAILSYVRYTEAPAAEEPDPDRCWKALAKSIPAERGLAERLRRIALLPMALPDDARREFLSLGTDEIASTLGVLSAVLTDPIGRLHLLDLALSATGILPDSIQTAQMQVNYLSTSRFEADTSLLLALVDVAYRALNAEEHDVETPTQPHLLAAWAHASRVAGILLAGRADAERFAESLQQWAPFPYRDLYAAYDTQGQDLAWPGNVRAVDLQVISLGTTLNRHRQTATQLDLDTVRMRLDGLVSGNPDPTTDVDLLRNPYLLSDVLHCLWGGDRAGHLRGLVEPQIAEQFSSTAFAARIDEFLSELTEAPESPNHWLMLWQQVRQCYLPPEAASRLDRILAGLDLDIVSRKNPLVLTPLMDLATHHVSDPSRVETYINRWAEGIDSDSYPAPIPTFVEQYGEKALEAFSDRLVNWMRNLAVRKTDDPDKEFARLLDGLALRSRRIAEYLRAPLGQIVRTQPFSRHRALRRSALCVRSRPRANH